MEKKTFDFNKYGNTITRISTLISCEEDKDVTFVFEGSEKVIKAHKCILKAASPVFKAMFSGDFKEKDEVIIEDIKPEVFQLLLDGIYLNEVKFGGAQYKHLYKAADLYYAAEKYDIQDLCDIAKDYLRESVHNGNTHLLLQKALLFNLSDVQTACEKFFKMNTYLVLQQHIGLSVADESMSVFFALQRLAILHEFELYLALEVMVGIGNLISYSKCLKQIRFLTMTTREVLACKLLTDSEARAIAANIESKLHDEKTIMPIPPHFSATTVKRAKLQFHQLDRQLFWVSILLYSTNYHKYLEQFMKFMSVPADRKEITNSLIKTARDELQKDGCDELKLNISKNVTEKIFSF